MNADIAAPARWSRLASLGLAMVGTGPLLMLAASGIWGLDIGEDLVFFMLPIVFGFGGAFLMQRPRTALRIVALVFGVLGAMMVFWTVFGLFSPDSFFDFVPGLLVIPGALIALVAGIGAIRSQRKGATSHPAEGRALQIVGSILGVLVIVSGVLSVTGRETVSAEDEASADVVVDLKDFEFDEDTYEVAGGATIFVKNSDPFLHTFQIDALDVDVTLGPGSEAVIVIPDEPGDYVLYCEPHTSDADDPGEDDMAARLEVS
jgi:plastocyanin